MAVNILTRKKLEKMTNSQLNDFIRKTQEHLIGKQNTLADENKKNKVRRN